MIVELRTQNRYERHFKLLWAIRDPFRSEVSGCRPTNLLAHPETPEGICDEWENIFA